MSITDGPKRRAGDGLAEKPVFILWGIFALIALGIAAVVFSATAAFTSANASDAAVERAAVQTTRNQVDVLRHRMRTEQGHECIARYFEDVVVAFAEGRREDVPGIKGCPAENLNAIADELERAERRLRAISPNDPLLNDEEHTP